MTRAVTTANPCADNGNAPFFRVINVATGKVIEVPGCGLQNGQ